MTLTVNDLEGRDEKAQAFLDYIRNYAQYGTITHVGEGRVYRVRLAHVVRERGSASQKFRDPY